MQTHSQRNSTCTAQSTGFNLTEPQHSRVNCAKSSDFFLVGDYHKQIQTNTNELKDKQTLRLEIPETRKHRFQWICDCHTVTLMFLLL